MPAPGQADLGAGPGTVGLLCGGGLLPVRVAQALKAQGYGVAAVGILGEADPAIEAVADSAHWTGIAALGRWMRIFRQAGAGHVLMVGAITKARMFASKASMLPDWRSIKVWYGHLTSREDHTILAAVADEFARQGFRVGTVPEFCPELRVRAGCLTCRRPKRKQWIDIRFGWPIAKQIAALQVGQCIVVKDRSVVAVEDMAGTDALLERAGRLTGGGATAVKVSKEGHDERFDIPCIGPGTVAALSAAGITCLAVEACRTLVLDRNEAAAAADRAGICIVAVGPDDLAPAGAD